MMKLGKFELDEIYCGDCQELMKYIPDNSIDLIVTDPPYGYSFMGKDWDKAVVSVEIWKECLRILKPGAFAFIMSAPRQDVLNQMITRIGQAGFNTGFTSIYWTYASGFPKAGNISKMVDKKLGAKRDIVIEEIIIPQNLFEKEKVIRQEKRTKMTIGIGGDSERLGEEKIIDILATPQAKSLEGSYGGFQPKLAVEIIIVAMKPLSEKTYVDQALKNKKGITWLDNGRIPYESEDDRKKTRIGYDLNDIKSSLQIKFKKSMQSNQELTGRFPANLLVSDDVLNVKSKGQQGATTGDEPSSFKKANVYGDYRGYGKQTTPRGDTGSYSRYFDLDKWTVSKGIKDTFPFLIVPKASNKEKNKGLERFENKESGDFTSKKCKKCNKFQLKGGGDICNCENPEWENTKQKNFHPTVKPKKIAHYLITLGSREGDIMVDMFCGSGSFLVSAKELNRRFLGFDTEMEYVIISRARLSAVNAIQEKLF